ncbi:MAG: glycosyltransferase family 39 protein [Bacteroidetes bacterium]|nr:glycosyltransferase family 39 protein [Bacteroidota bacterium]MBS1540874.1 glycosyltransferase family 39 protein [Bacteroidota bacterium]
MLRARLIADPHIKKQILWLIAIASAVRLLLAAQLELGNDEVYYWTYVRYPDWSHFDHPPMVGIIGQLFSLNLLLKSDFFLRLGPIVLSAVSIWIIFLVGKKIKDERTGLFAAYLFTGSVYGFIISGFSFIPDSPLVFFWLLAIYWIVDFLLAEKITQTEKRKILWFGLVAGLAMLSKYQGAFLWIGVFIYVICYHRAWLRQPSFYLAGIISAVVLLPVVIWNVQNDFISFTFHSERVTPSWQFRPDYLLTELGGQLAYNNPIVYVLIIIAIIAWIKGKTFLDKKTARMLGVLAAPLWIIFTSFSVFRSTLPHWTAPAFLSLILFAAAYWSNEEDKRRAIFWVRLPVYFLSVLIVIAFWLVDFSPLQVGKNSDQVSFGENDFTQDIYGWSQIGESFKKISAREEASGSMPKEAALISNKWFPGAHLDFYVAQPSQRKLFLIGPMNDLHKYAWVNEERGGLEKGKDYYHIAVSNLYKDPHELFGSYFEKILPMDTVQITRGGKTVRYAFFYKLKNYRGNFVNPLPYH